MDSHQPPRLPVSKYQAQHIRRMEEADINSSTDTVSKRRIGRTRSSSAPSAIGLPKPSSQPWTILPDTITETTPRGTTATMIANPAPQSPSPPGSPETEAAFSAVERSRESEVDNVLEQLNYPKNVVKLVAKYRPTTSKQLLCELKKEEARTRWALVPMSNRRPVELLEQQLRQIDKAFGNANTEVVLDDLHERHKKRSMLRIIDAANARRNSSSEDLSKAR